MTTTLLSLEIWRAFNVLAGACLGGSFYVLIKTQAYLVNRSYDPKFNSSYISRFITGVIAGVILAYGLADFVNSKIEGSLANTLTPGVLGILGGFSAEAVEVILQRVVDIILAAVRGDGSDAVKAKLADAVGAKTTKVEDALDVAMDKNGIAGDPANVHEALKAVRTELAARLKTP